jgi:amino acid transporter
LLFEEGTGVEPVFVIFHGLLACVLVVLPYEELVEIATLMMALPSFACIYAYMYYKWTDADRKRPFNVPGGMWGAAIMAVPVGILTAFNAYLACFDPAEVVGMPYGKAVVAGGLTFGALAVHGASPAPYVARPPNGQCCCPDGRVP